MALGLGLVAWVSVTLWWGEPFTSLYTRHEQKALSKELQALDRKWSGTVRLSPAVPSRRAEAGTAETSVVAALRTRAAAYRRRVTRCTRRRTASSCTHGRRARRSGTRPEPPRPLLGRHTLS
jgi:hypothetical protein